MTASEEERAAITTDLMRGILKMSAISHRAGTAMNRDAGLTNARWILIDQTAETPEPLTLSEHARRLGFSRQAIRRLTAEMEKDGLITLVPDPADKRALTVSLTESGHRLHLDALARGMAYNRAISDGLDPQLISEALKIVTRLTAAMIDLERRGD